MKINYIPGLKKQQTIGEPWASEIRSKLIRFRNKEWTNEELDVYYFRKKKLEEEYIAIDADDK